MLISLVCNRKLLLFLLVFSVAINVFLARSHQQPVAMRQAAPVSAVQPGSSARAEAPVNVGQVLAGLEQAAFSEARQIASGYWKPDVELAYSRAVFAAREKFRSDLIELRGADVRRDPSLSYLFRPLDPLLSFLSADQQIAIQGLRFERDLKLRALARDPQPATGLRSGIDAQAVQLDYRNELLQILSQAELFELELRESPVARRIRHSGVELTEQEFRECFRLLSRLQSGHSSPAAASEVRAQLRSLLGNARFAVLWSAGDPFYTQLQQLMSRSAVDAAVADPVYGILSDFEDQRLQVAGFAELDPARASTELSRIAAAERGELEKLVGTELTSEILRARAVGSYYRFASGGEATGQ